MLNIKNIGNIESIDELVKGKELPSNAHKFKESDKLSDIFYDGLIISLPLLIGILALTIHRYNDVEDNLHFTVLTWITLGVTLVLLYFSNYVHELIHAIFYPRNASKTICEIKTQGAHLLYCDAKVSKGRFILITLAPVLALGVIPFVLWYILAPIIPMPYNFAVVVFYFVSFVSALGDYANVFNTLRSVPNKALVFNFGIHSYWMRRDE